MSETVERDPRFRCNVRVFIDPEVWTVELERPGIGTSFIEFPPTAQGKIDAEFVAEAFRRNWAATAEVIRKGDETE